MIMRKKSLSLLIALAMFLTAFAVTGVPEKAYAAGVDEIGDAYTTLYYTKAKPWNSEWIADKDMVTIDMATAKSSNPSVAVLTERTWTDDGKTYGSY